MRFDVWISLFFHFDLILFSLVFKSPEALFVLLVLLCVERCLLIVDDRLCWGPVQVKYFLSPSFSGNSGPKFGKSENFCRRPRIDRLSTDQGFQSGKQEGTTAQER